MQRSLKMNQSVEQSLRVTDQRILLEEVEPDLNSKKDIV